MKPSIKSTSGRSDSISYPKKQRGRVTNGRKSFVTGDGNSRGQEGGSVPFVAE